MIEPAGVLIFFSQSAFSFCEWQTNGANFNLSRFWLTVRIRADFGERSHPLRLDTRERAAWMNFAQKESARNRGRTSSFEIATITPDYRHASSKHCQQRFISGSIVAYLAEKVVKIKGKRIEFYYGFCSCSQGASPSSVPL